MLETLGFLHISSKNPVDADIANRKHYSAPAGALTLFLGVFGFQKNKKRSSHLWVVVFLCSTRFVGR